MYDKSIHLDCGFYYVEERRDTAVRLHGPYVTFDAARAQYDRLESLEEDGFGYSAGTLNVNPLHEWFEDKLEREDLFEEFVAEAEYAYCR